MGNPIFRFTLRHEIEGSLQVSEMDGWLDSKLKLERHEDFHSLVEYFEGAFIFYGNNGVDNGGIDFIRFIEQNYGPDATLNIDIEVSFDSAVTYEFIFVGQLDLTTLNELKDNRAQIAIIRDDFWAKFISRKSTPVNLQATTDLDGASITPVQNILTILTSQKVRALFQGENGEGTIVSNVVERWDIAGNEFGIIDFPTIIRDEIEEKFSYPIVDSPTRPFDLFDLKYGGVYQIDFSMSVWSIIEHSAAQAATQFEFSINNNTPIIMTRTDIGTPGVDQRTEFTYSDTLNLVAGDQLRFYIRNTSGSLITVLQPKKSLYLSYLNVVADTIFPETRDEAFLIHDAGAAILKSYGLGVDNPFYSEYLGGLLTNARVYEQDGCGWHYGLIRGLQLRGYDLDEKQFSASFDHWWKGGNPILNLGLGYDQIVGAVTPEWNPFTLPALPLWGIANTSAQAWFWTGGIANPFLTVPSGITAGTDSDWFLVPTPFDVGHTYKYELQFTAFSDVSDSVDVSVVIGDNFFVILEQQTQNVVASPAGVSGTVTIEFIAVASADRMAVIANYPSGSGNDGSIVIDSFMDLTPSVPASDGLIDVIRVEEKEFFYDPIPSVYFDYVFEISREYDDDRIFNKIEIGYANWQSEDISGIDDPQTKHTYATRFKKIGKGIELHSDFIAASLAIEVTRRQTIEKSKDYKFDNNTFIISLNPDDVSPDAYIPELDENYDSITNLLNSETRYNPGLTPGRNFLRWINYFNIGLAAYQSSVYKFTNGEGNYDMTSEMIPNACGDDFGGEVLSEKQSIPVTSDRLHISMLYTIEINLAWDDYVLMRANRKKAIGISQTDANHTAFFIKSLEYELCKGKATIKAWPKEYFEITQTDFVRQMIECVAPGECGTGALDRTTSDGEGRVTSDGQCRTIA